MGKASNIVAGTMIVALMSCKSSEPTGTGTVVLKDSCRVEYRERVEPVHDTVTITIPVQSAEKITYEGKSHLETDYAVSDAWINADGSLRHSISNKAMKMDVDVIVPHKTTETARSSVKEVPVEVDRPVYVERELSGWQAFRLKAFWWLVLIVAGTYGYLFRNPIVSVVKKILLRY